MADADKKTVKDLVNSQNVNKPQTGTSPSSGLGISLGGGYTPGQTLGGSLQDTIRDNQARNNSNTDTSKRVGDWIYKGNGQWEPVAGSETYVKLNSNVVHGGYQPMQGLGISDVIGAVSGGVTAGAITGATTGGVGGVIGGLAGFVNSLFGAQAKHRDDFFNQEVDYESAIEEGVDKNGKKYYTIRYDKLADAGTGSGSIVKDAIDTTNTKAMLTGDNSLSINVTPTFAASERFSDILSQLKEIFPNGLTMDKANEVVDEETGQTYLDKINQTIKQEESNFYYNAQTFYDLKKIAPNASDEALQEAANTRLIGYLDTKALEASEIVIYNSQNEKKVVNAKAYLDSIKDMDKGKRNDYMSSIGNRLQSNDISDDEKVVLKAQVNALYDASRNDGEYHGIYERDFFDEVASAQSIVPLMRWGDLWNTSVNVTPILYGLFGGDMAAIRDQYGWKELDTFYENEVLGPLVNLASTVTSLGVLSEFTNGTEALMRQGATAVGGKLPGPLGRFLSGVNTFAKQDSPLPFTDVIKGNMGIGSWLKGTTTQAGFMLGADVVYEAGKAASAGLSGRDFDFWGELGQDVAMDALMTWGPRNYLSAVNLPKYEYRRYDGDATKKYDADKEILEKADEIYENNIKDLVEDEFDTGDLYPEGTGIRKYAGLVEITADELAIRHAKRLDKLTDSNVVIKVQELFGDKNAAMAKLAIQVRAAGGSLEDYRKALRYANDIKKTTEDTYMEFKQFGNVKGDFNRMSEVINRLLPKKKDFTKDEINYINAAANRYRFLAENKGDKEAEAYINKFYNKYIEKIDPERAKELDELADAMRKVVANVLDFNKFKGLLSDADIKKLRNSPAYKNGMFLPVWSKGAGVNGKWANEIGQGRAGRKKVFNKDELIAVEDLEHPLVSVSQYINNNMRNIAINDRALAIIDAANIPGVGIHVYSDTGGSLSEVSNLKELSEEFGKRYENIVKKVKKEYPSHQQWVKINSDLVMNSQALQKTEELNTLKKQGDSLKRKLRKLEKAQEQSLSDLPEGTDIRALEKQIEEAKAEKDSLELKRKSTLYGTAEYEEAKAAYEEAEEKVNDLQRELGKIVEGGNAKAELTPEVEDLDTLYAKDPKVDAELKRLRKKIRTIDDALERSGYEFTRDGIFDGEVHYLFYPSELQDGIKKALMDSHVAGRRKALFSEWGAERGAQHDYNAIENYISRAAEKAYAENENISDGEMQKVIDDATKEALDTYLTPEEVASVIRYTDQSRLNERREIINERNQKLAMFEDAKSLIRDLGITSAIEIYEGALPGAWGYYRAARGQRFSRYIAEDGSTRYYVPDDVFIRVGLDGVVSAEDFESTIIHEYAHAAFDRANNRVPIVNDLLRLLGINARVSEAVANSRDVTELIAHVTQKTWLYGIGNDFSERFKQDRVVQNHLKSIMENLGEEAPKNFKERFMNMLRAAAYFVEAKLLRLTDVKTFAEFYTGLTRGDFRDEMRVSAHGRPAANRELLLVSKGDEEREPELNSALDFHLEKVNIVALKMAEEIQTIKDQIDANGAEQARLTDEIKNDARKMLEDAQKLAKGAPVELDINSFVNVELTNALKKAYRSNTTAGDIHSILNNAVELANPYVNRNTVIQTQAAEAAEKYRKRVAKHMAYKRNVEKGKKLSAEHINELVDKVTDKVVEKVVGKRNQVSAINDAELTRILNSGDGHTIRYMIDGKEQRVVLTGKGSEELVKEFYAPEFTIKGPFKQKLLNAANKIANAKRYLTTSADVSRVLPNLARDWSRGIVTTGGAILLSPDDLRTDALEYWDGDEKAIEKINNGFALASAAIEGDTFTQSMLTAKKNRPKTMIKAMRSEDGNAYTRFKAKTTGEKLSMLQDMGEEFTRKHAMSVAYYQTLADASARGASIDDAIKQAVEAAYFYGREATTNFSRRGKLISQIAQMVPYLTQNFSSLESFKYTYLDNPIAVGRSLKATVTAYTALIAIALSNEESRKKYFLLTEYDRSNNIIIPLTNDMILTIPLDENIAAFLTPYRRMVETLNGVDPEAFYLWGAEFLEALSPLDLTGFSEGDKFNVVRGFQKLGSQLIPTWAMPFIEAATGTDWYRGTDISIDEEYVGARTGNYTPSAGELTTKSANSKLLASVADGTGIPQWILQRFVSEYGGNVGQYMLNTLDKLTGATDEEQGGKEWKDSIFRPFTGADSDAASNAFWSGVKIIEDKKKRLQNELRTLKNDIDSSAGEEKAELQKKRQEKIAKYGTDVSDFVSQYLDAYEITGGLTKSEANRIWHLYSLYDQDNNMTLYADGTVEEYFADKAKKSANKKATNLAAQSDFDQYYRSNDLTDYDTSYAMSALKNTIYGVPTQQMVDLANILEDTTDYANSYTKLRSDVKAARQKLYEQKRWDERDKLAYQYDYKILAAIYPYLLKHGVAETLNRTAVMDYLADWIIVPTSEQKTAKGRYVPSLGVDSQKEKAFKKQFIKKMYGVSGE